jgi:large subunit ribosomal protein L15
MKKQRRKFSRMRGSGNHGGGHKKKRRGGGSRGGRGLAGRHKHKYSLTVSKTPEFYGKKGFPSLNKKRDIVINVGSLLKIAQGRNEIDLGEAGYTKLLADGNIDAPITVKVKSCSEPAREKIEKAGGKVITESIEETE